MNTVEPIVEGLGKDIEVFLPKRLDHICEPIVFRCPECGHEVEFLRDVADVDYGNFYGQAECWECGTPYEHHEYEVKAFIRITKVNKEE